VINFLNTRPQVGSGEGESTIATSSGSILAAAPAVTGVSTWSTNTMTVGNNLIPMKDVFEIDTSTGNGVEAMSLQSTIDLAMSDILGVDSEDQDVDFDYMEATAPVSESAFDLAISDLFDTSKKKNNGR